MFKRTSQQYVSVLLLYNMAKTVFKGKLYILCIHSRKTINNRITKMPHRIGNNFIHIAVFSFF